MMLSKGYVQIYTGDGKGKTSASLGLAFRALGRGLKVYMFQFMKPPESSGEHFAATAFGENMTIQSLGKKGFILKDHSRPQDRELAVKALAKARRAMESGEYDLIILDEVNVAVHMGLLDVEALMEFIEAKPGHVELVLTGRKAHPDVVARADLVSEIKPVKHYYHKGVEAREGIEY